MLLIAPTAKEQIGKKETEKILPFPMASARSCPPSTGWFEPKQTGAVRYTEHQPEVPDLCFEIISCTLRLPGNCSVLLYQFFFCAFYECT